MEKKFIDWHSADIIAALRKKGASLCTDPKKLDRLTEASEKESI